MTGGGGAGGRRREESYIIHTAVVYVNMYAIVL